jgi:hypothetical protein
LPLLASNCLRLPQRFGHGGSSATRGRGILFERLRVRPPWGWVEGSEGGGGGEAEGEGGEGGEGAEAKGGGGGGGGGERPTKRQKRKRRAPWLDALYLSAFQSSMFNAWLAERVSRGLLGTLLCGDLVSFPQVSLMASMLMSACASAC